MLSISRLKNVNHAMTYYKTDNYYAKDQQDEYTQWLGNSAEKLGLKGKIKVDDFNKILNGQNKKGETLVKSKKVEQKISYEMYFKAKEEFKSIVDNIKLEESLKNSIVEIYTKISEDSKKIGSESIEKNIKKMQSIVNKSNNLSIEQKQEIKDKLKKNFTIYKKTSERRPAYDLTFSAPKSLSIAALVAGNEKLVEAHRLAVKKALETVEEKYSRVNYIDKEKNQKITENSGNILAATFEHDVSRKLDPQLHTHCVLMNLTEYNGSWKALNSDGFFYNSKNIGAIYQNELAKIVKGLGYKIEVKDNGTFDIVGYSEEQLKQFSKRTEQLKELGATNQKEATKLVLHERDKKPNENEYSREELKKKWNEEANVIGISHPVAKKQQKNEINDIDSLNYIIHESINEISKNEISFKKEKLEEIVLKKTLGSYDYNIISNTIDDVLKSNTKKISDNHRAEYVTNKIMESEKESIEIMQRGKNLFEGIVTTTRAKEIAEELHNQSIANGFDGINQGQREALELMLTSNDRIYAWQGVAGAGKTFSLESAIKVAKKEGFKVIGFAPSAKAKDNLAEEAKLDEAFTVASLLVKETVAGRGQGKEIWVIDEAGLMSAEDANALLKKAEIENARVLLVGDTRQLSSVGAGNPFKQLQENGMLAAQLTQGMRQKKGTIIKESVDLIADGKHKDGLDILEKTGKVYECEKDHIISNMANDYLKLSKDELEKSLFISSTNYEKQEITKLVRSELVKRGEIKNIATINILENTGYNEHALKFINVYKKGDIIVLSKSSEGLKANTAFKVSEIDYINNRIKIENEKGQKIIDIKKIKCNLFREKSIEVGEGDALKWTKNQNITTKDKFGNKSGINKRMNGQDVKVLEINKEKNTIKLKDSKGKIDEIKIKDNHFLDYSYITTVFSSQGKTCNKVFASLTNIDRENFYVAVSRAKLDCKLYCESKEELYKKVERFGANETALEKVSQSSKLKDLNIKSHMNEKNDPKKISKEYLESIKIDRKINELSYEVTFKLGFDPNKNELLKYDNDKEFKNNFDFIKGKINYGLNNRYNIKNNKDRLKLDLDKLEKIYKQDTREISSYFQNELYNKVNNKEVKQEIKAVLKNQPQKIENKEIRQNITENQKIKRKLKL
jgi:conjugative relaxase-like TrwC/TraI family protein